MPIPRWRPGVSISAARLNLHTDRLNELERLHAPRQIAGAFDNDLITDDLQDAADTTAEQWHEVGRLTATVRITNPEDDTQYVDVDRVERVTLQRPDGIRVTLNLEN